MTLEKRTIDEDYERLLIDRLCSNDREALAQVYDTYASIAYGLARRTLGTESDAEDVVQESFLALWKQAGRIDAQKGLRSYLLTIVHHKAVDRLRQRGRRAEVALELDAPIPASAPEPAEVVSRQSEADAVRDALKDLPQDQRSAIELTYFVGLTIREVAERSSLPLGTVKSRLRLALGHLRQRLAEP
jgi:RNA polymerase sigma-70 factor (ECF subfamily)